MSVSVTMPRLGESVTEGTVTRWLKNVGEHVDADEPLLEVSTDKVDTEVPSPASGTLTAIKVQEDETVEIGVELATIDSADGAGALEAAPQAQAPAEAAPAAEPSPQPTAEPPASAPEPVAEQPDGERPAPAPSPEPAVSAPAPPVTPPAASASPSAEPEADDDDLAGTYITPLVRKLAGEHGVNLSTIKGTGVGGRIRKSDVLAAASTAPPAAAPAAAAAAPAAAAPAAGVAPTAPAAGAPAAAPEAPAAPTPAVLTGPVPAVPTDGAPAVPPAAAAVRGKVEKMSRMRQVIAARMVESLQTSAQLTTVVEVDITKIARLRDRAKAAFLAREGVKLTYLPFFAKATVEALKVHPIVNASVNMDEKTITYHDAEHLGIAVDSERGLAVPVIHNAGDLNIGGLARKIADLAERTRANRVSPDELGGGTFTITNTGSRGALFDTPIINQPQVGILGTGAVVKRPVVVVDDDLGETIAVRSMVYLALSYDHRIVDGADAARFLATVKQRLEEGNFAADLGLA